MGSITGVLREPLISSGAVYRGEMKNKNFIWTKYRQINLKFKRKREERLAERSHLRR